MDTDSFFFEVTNQNFNDIMFEHKEYFDLCISSKDSKHHNSTNKKAPEKNERSKTNTKYYKDFALKSKSYIIFTTDNK